VEKQVHGVKVCKKVPPVSHLSFADYNIMFLRATKEECSEVATFWVYMKRGREPCFLKRMLI